MSNTIYIDNWFDRVNSKFKLQKKDTGNLVYSLGSPVQLTNFTEFLSTDFGFDCLNDVLAILPKELLNQVTLVELTIATSKNSTITNDNLIIIGISYTGDLNLGSAFSFLPSISNPFLHLQISANKDWYAEILADAKIGSGSEVLDLRVAMTLPDKDISLSMRNTGLKVSSILTDFQLPEIPFSKDLLLESFNLQASLEAKTYQLQFQLTENWSWTFPLGNESITLTVMNTSVNIESGNQGSFDLYGSLQFKNILFNVNFKKTWGTNSDTYIMGTLAQNTPVKLADIISIDELPDPFKKLSVSSLNLSYDSQEGFGFSATITDIWSDSGNIFSLSFNVSKSIKSFTGSWHKFNNIKFNFSDYSPGYIQNLIDPQSANIDFEISSGVTTASIDIVSLINLGTTNATKPKLTINISKIFGSQPSTSLNATLVFQKLIFDLNLNHNSASGTEISCTYNSGSTPVSLVDLVEDILPYLGDKTVPAFIPKVSVDSLSLMYDTGNKNLSFTAKSGNQSNFTLGNVNYAIQFDISIQSTINQTTQQRTFTGMMKGDIVLDKATITLQYDIGNASVITGYWKANQGDSINILNFFSSMGLSSGGHQVPSQMEIDLTELALLLDVKSGFIKVKAKTISGFEAFAVASRTSGQWGFIFGVTYQNQAKLSQLPIIGNDLKPLDFLSLKNSCLLFSTIQQPGFSIAGLDLPVLPSSSSTSTQSTNQVTKGSTFPSAGINPINLKPGVLVSFEVDLSSGSGLCKSLRNLSGKDSISFCAELTQPFSASYIEAILGSPFKIKMGNENLNIRQAALRITLSGAFMIIGKVSIPMNGDQLDVDVSLDISDTGIQFTTQIKDTTPNGEPAPLPIPMGLKGLQMDEVDIEIGVEFTPPGVDMGFEGKFNIINQPADSDDFTIVLSLDGEIPNVNYFSSYIAQLNFNELVTAVTGNQNVSLPSVFNSVQASDLSLYWSESQQILPDNTIAMPGFGFNGNISFFGLKAHSSLQVNTSGGIRGMAEMSPINWGPLSITGNGKGVTIIQEDYKGNWIPLRKALPSGSTIQTRNQVVVPPGGAVFAVSSSSSPYFDTSFNFSLLKAVNLVVQGQISNTGLEFSFYENIANIFTCNFDCKIDTTGFSTNAGFTFQLNTEVGPFDLLGFKAGPYHINTGLTASFILNISESSFYMKLDGSFWFEGFHLTLPTIELYIAFSSLADLPSIIESKVKDCAQEILKDILDEAKKIWDDAKKVAEDIEKGAEIAATAIKDEAIKVGEGIKKDAEKVAAAFNTGVLDAEKEVSKIADDTKQVIANGVKDVEVAGKVLENGVLDVVHDIAALPGELNHEFSVIDNDVKNAIQETGKVIAKLGEDIKNTVNNIINVANEAAKSIVHAAEVVGQDIVQAAQKFASFVDSFAKNVISNAIHIFGEGARELVQGFDDIKSDFNKYAPQILSDIADEAKKIGNDIVGGVKKVCNAVGHFFRHLF